MKVEEAKKKWCPFSNVERFARVSNGAGNFIQQLAYSCNRVEKEGEVPKGVLCIASACMAWQWDRIPEENNNYGESILIYKDSEDNGYCGLSKK